MPAPIKLLALRPAGPPTGATNRVVLLGEDEMIVRLLRPLREKV